MNKMKKVLFGLVMGVALFFTVGCANDADVVSSNLSMEADNFKVIRKITFINTVTDQALFTVEGNMSIKADTSDNQLEITAKTGKNEFKKHFLGLSPTTVYIVEQLEWEETNQYRFKIVMKPSTLIPDIEVR